MHCRISSKYLQNYQKLPHCPPRPAGPTSSTPRRNSSGSSTTKSSTRYKKPDGGGARQEILHGSPRSPQKLRRPGN
eukprot:8198994-Pyramimonas_sp.AAC.1